MIRRVTTAHGRTRRQSASAAASATAGNSANPIVSSGRERDEHDGSVDDERVQRQTVDLHAPNLVGHERDVSVDFMVLVPDQHVLLRSAPP